MAQGDAKYLRDFPLKLNRGDYNVLNTYSLVFLSDTYSLVNVDATNPALGDFTETTGGNISKTVLANVTITRAGTEIKFDADDPATFLKDALNPADVRTLMIINDTVSDNAAQVFDATVDGTTPLDLINNDLTISFSASGFMTITLT